MTNIFLQPTSKVSAPPTMLRPRPVRPLEISMVVSHPGMMGQVAGSETNVAGVDDLLVSETIKHPRYSKMAWY